MSDQQLALFDLAPPAVKARDEALTRVAQNNDTWRNKALCAMTPIFKRELPTFTGEKLRLKLSSVIGPPSHPNAMGELTMFLVRTKIIKPTGKWVQMQTKKSHGRSTKTYYWG